MIDLSRRDVMGGAAAFFAAAALGGCGRKAERALAGPRVGIQLYTVRDAMAQDMPAALARIAAIGYDEVEFHDYFGFAPHEVRRILGDLGVVAPSVHMNARRMREEPAPLIDAAAAVGHKYLVIAWLQPDDRRTIDQYKEWAETFNRIGEQCASAGLRFAYHNHEFEFEAIDGVVPYDVLMRETDPALVSFELDFYWARAAGRDIPALLRQAPGRFPLCHIKDMDADGAMVDVGDGVIDFADILGREEAAGFRHYFVEHDRPLSPFAAAERGYHAMRSVMTVLEAAKEAGR